jgi:hypothetical protein
MKQVAIFWLSVILALPLTSLTTYGQGRGGRGPAPQSRRPANVGIPSFPAGLPMPGTGQPTIPSPNSNANPRAATAPVIDSGSRPSLATVAEQIQARPKLNERLQGMLGTTSVEDASSGYDNLGRFVSAVQVSNNLDIPLTTLNSSVTGESAMSLGEAIHMQRPDLTPDQANEAAKKAEDEAEQILDEES